MQRFAVLGFNPIILKLVKYKVFTSHHPKCRVHGPSKSNSLENLTQAGKSLTNLSK